LLQQSIQNEDIIEFAKILGQQTDFQDVLRLVANKAAQFTKADLALILMLNPDTRETVKTIIKDGKHIDQKKYRDIHIHIGGWIVNNSKPFLSQNIQKDNRFAKGLFDKVPIKSVSGVPLIIEGIIIGALILLYRNPQDFINANIMKYLENIASISVPFLRNAQKIREFFDSAVPEATLLLKYKNAGLYGTSPRFVTLLHTIEAATKCDVRVILDGKTGTGKELIARAIHKFSSRFNFPFIALDCGAIPHTLLESELFGHKRGAFTGAHYDRQGLLLDANGGTLFMDEINNLPYDMQSKLLRVLEEGEVRPIGGDKVVKTDVRIIAASSVPLKKLVEDHLFREDLFFRLHVFPICVPDLNEREEDIPLLANHFLQNYVRQQNKNVQNFQEEVIDFVKHRIWSGNIRELENFVERLVTLTPKDISIIDAESFPEDLKEELIQFRKKSKSRYLRESLKTRVEEFEAQLIKRTLVDCKWNQSETARRLKTSEKNIRYKIRKLNIRKPVLD
jgi:transcriptional regulator with GAF, ATPase, and Fis domain